MRIPLSWLAEYVALDPDTSISSIHAALVKVGFEEEGAHGFDITGPVVVGEVLAFTPEPQTNGKTIRWCSVRVGAEGTGTDDVPEVRGIVCGAANFFVGDKVVVSLPGSVLPGPFPIAARKTYGHVSDGMIASARELGLGEEHDGILRLASLGLDPAPGTDALKLLGLTDAAVEVNVTPDRGYAFSVRGIAREYAHSTGAAFTDPAAIELLPAGTGFPVRIDDRAPLRGHVGASVFLTRAVRGIDPACPTPAWMISRLTLAGMRSISLTVDITNYVMLELGQPLHAYDLDTLSGGITVRRAEPRESITTLDGSSRALDPQDLLITDDSGPIGIAGVMGGSRTEVNPATTDVLLEAANFDPVTIARSARRHKLPSEASKRFERGVDPEVAAAALARAGALLVELAGGTIDALGSEHRQVPDAPTIELAGGYVSGLVGVDYPAAEVRQLLEEIGARVDDGEGDALLVTPPSWRPDLVDAAGLAEEVARLGGYDRIPSVLPVAPSGRGLTREQKLRRGVAQVLAANGAVEVLTFPFVDRRAIDAFNPSNGEAAALRVANPLDVDAPYLRTSLLPGLLGALKRNRDRGLVDVSLFEVGLVFAPESGAIYGTESVPPIALRPTDEVLAELDSGIPPQPRHAAVVLAGLAIGKQPGQPAVPAGWQDALTAAQQIAAAVRVTLKVAQAEHRGFHPGRTASLSVLTSGGPVIIGYAGELLPAVVEEVELQGVIAAAELDLDLLLRLAETGARPLPIRALPAATQDLSLLVAAPVAAGDVLSAVVEGAGDLLEDARLVDDYRGEGVPAGQKSLTIALRFRAEDRTLTAAEATAAKLAGLELASSRFGASLRE